MRVHWLLKAVLPLGIVLTIGIGIFLWATIALEPSARRSILFVAGGGAAIICSVVLVALLVLVQRPLMELQESITEVGAGNLNVEVKFAKRDDEIGELGRIFNGMVHQLRERREQVRSRYQAELSRAEHLATLGELAAGLAHELRNPLAGIAGVIDVLGQDIADTDPAREIWNDVRGEIENIQRILNDLLEYTRPRTPNKLASDINATVEQAVHRAQQQALSRPIHFRLFRSEPLLVQHDAGLIGQVLLNLLLNAIQAIESDGSIEIRVQSDQRDALIIVSDTGKGISPDHLPLVFRPFFTTRKNGTGLGLSLAQRIAESHGGIIEVTSEPGQKTSFTLHLPLRDALPALK